jgi:transcriptional regulator of acetoin/glycerol metabolism
VVSRRRCVAGTLIRALTSRRGNISAVARELGRDRKQIHRWIARLAIDVRDPQ